MSDWKRRIKIALLQPTRVRPIQTGLARFNQAKARILMYHRVTDSLGPLDAPYNAVTIQTFDQQMAWLAANYRVVTLDQLVAQLRKGQRLPDRTVTITFDDGFRDNYCNAFPILQRYQLPATIYVCPGALEQGQRLWFDRVSALLNRTQVINFRLPLASEIEFDLREAPFNVHYRIHDLLKTLSPIQREAAISELAQILKVDESADSSTERAMLSWEELKELQAGGITIGAHTMTHPILSHLNQSDLEYEIIECQRQLELGLGQPVRHFSYPNGSPLDFDERAVRLVAAHYDSATTTSPGLVSAAPDIYRLPRIHVDDEFEFFPGKLELPKLSRSAGSRVTYFDHRQTLEKYALHSWNVGFFATTLMGVGI